MDLGRWVQRKAPAGHYCENGPVSMITDPHCSLQTGQLRGACERYLGVQGLFTKEMNPHAVVGSFTAELALTIISPGPWGFSASTIIVSCSQSNGKRQGWQSPKREGHPGLCPFLGLWDGEGSDVSASAKDDGQNADCFSLAALCEETCVCGECLQKK